MEFKSTVRISWERSRDYALNPNTNMRGTLEIEKKAGKGRYAKKTFEMYINQDFFLNTPRFTRSVQKNSTSRTFNLAGLHSEGDHWGP